MSIEYPDEIPTILITVSMISKYNLIWLDPQPKVFRDLVKNLIMLYMKDKVDQPP